MTDIDVTAADREYCDDPCHLAPIHGFSDFQRLVNWLCWFAVVRIIPVSWLMAWPFRWMLPLCGNHAYGCTCRDKNLKSRTLAALAREGEG